MNLCDHTSLYGQKIQLLNFNLELKPYVVLIGERENFPVAQCRAAVRDVPACTGSLLYQHSREGQAELHRKLWSGSKTPPEDSHLEAVLGDRRLRDSLSTLASLPVLVNGQGREELVRSNLASMGRNEMVVEFVFHQQAVTGSHAHISLPALRVQEQCSTRAWKGLFGSFQLVGTG